MRTPAHQDPHELNRARTLCESNHFIAAVRILDVSMCEWLPVVVIVGLQMHRIIARPVFNAVVTGVRGSPVNANGIHWFALAKIDDHPLRMSIVRFASET